ncbi:hypothetical protein VTL71DRAFT_166 [Oculimacula yallundae]|uniref:Uncharacterized protein n=1 Tax=Oculimacula yallundae TaxID=86028 RepID=A0ABR4CZE1_9HELO
MTFAEKSRRGIAGGGGL